MRITSIAISRNYTRNLNSNQEIMNKYSTQLSTQRKFTSMSEDTSAGIRALQLRRTIEEANSHLDTAKLMSSQLAAAEGQMMQVVALGQDIQAKYTTALNGTMGEDERKVIANEVEQLMQQILTCANGKFSDRYLFGGTNNSAPFATITDSKGNITGLSYNGVDVSQLTDSKGNILPEYQYLLDDAAFVDIGMGLSHDSNGKLVETSAFKSTLNGLDFLGMGDNNIFLICNEIVEALRSPNFTNDGYYSELLDRVTAAYKEVTLEVTKLGADSQFLDYSIERLTDELINLYERQSDVEQVDAAEAIMNYKMSEFVYSASLQMGQRLLQPTLFNFISN